ncbi:MAG: UvrD-helicase domain-containing protein [Bacteroidales bacterium]|nr:UvrD-helicase domain-containing protein [Bacteroidales bacterium]
MSQNQNKPFKIYKASAGSGKTFTIVKEYLTLCLGNTVDAYREILAVTFTNKAANEMKTKILGYLLGIIESSEEDDIVQMKNYLISAIGIEENLLIDRAKRLYVNILHNYSDFAVCTIDSFVQRLSRTFARELNLPGQYSVILDNDDLVDEIIKRISDEIGKDDFITMILSNFVEYNLSEETSWNVKKLLGEYIEKLLSEDAYRKGSYKNFSNIDEPKYKEIKDYVHSENESLKESLSLIIKDIEAEETKRGISEQDYNGKAKTGLPSVKKKMSEGKSNVTTATIDKILNGEKRWNDAKSRVSDDTIVDVYIDAIKRYKSLYSKKLIFSDIEKDLYLYVLRNHIFELIRDYIAETSQVHISEFNKRISDILDDCSVPFIYERIGEKYRHYFIDEFQDTSVLQWQNFLPLVENSLAFGNMNMLVGDAKQSIYRFRSGEVEQIINLPHIFRRPEGEFGERCEQQFVNSAQRMSLGTNYRSSKNVIKFNNTFFRFAASCDPRFAFTDVFNDAEQIYDAKKQGGFVSVEVFHGDLKATEFKEKVKKSMLKQIIDLHNQNIDYKDITILVRSNSDGTDIANYLVENGIEVLSAESVLLQSSDKVQLIVNTLKLMVDEDNPVTQKAVEYYSTKTGFKDVRKSDSIIEQSGGLYDICIQICNQYNFNLPEDVFLQYFMNMVFDWQSRHSAGIGDFLEFWDKKKNKLAVQISGDLDCVQIMTIHKAKGLEFKVVMYPYADTSLKSSKGFTQSELWLQCADFEDTKNIPYLDAFLLKLSKDKLAGTSFEPLVDNEEKKTMLDTLDVMYVAMTRAKNMLFVYTNDKRPADGYNLFTDFFADNLDIQHIKSENDTPGFNDYFAKNDEFKIQEGEEMTAYNYGDIDSTISKIKEKKKKDDKIKILELKKGEEAPKALNWTEKLKVDADPTMIWAEKGTFMPEEWGSLVHQILSKIQTIADAEKALRPYVSDGTIDEKQAASLLETFRKITELPEIKPAFSDDAIVKNEMDIHTSVGKMIRPDRYAETPQGTILIDYKTGKAYEEYYEQLRNYMGAIIQMNPMQQIKAYLVYIGDEVKAEEVKLDRLF